MEERSELRLKILLLIILSIPIVISLLFILMVDKVYAIEVRPSTCISASDNFSSTDCNQSTNLTIGQSNYLNIVTTYGGNLPEKTYNFSLYYDLYDIDVFKRDNLYIRTPIVHIYIDGVEVNTQAPTIIQTQRAWCEGNTGCWRIRTFTTNFSWRGNLSNRSITWNIRSYTGNGYIQGWIEPHTGLITSTGPYYTYGQSFAEYNDDTQQAVENQTSQMQEGFANINENNNRLTESVNETITNKSNEVKDAIENQNKKCENYNLTNNIKIDNYYLSLTNDLVSNSNFGISDYIPLEDNKTYTLTRNFNNNNTSVGYCLYNEDKSLINCEAYNRNTSFSITGAKYIRYNISKVEGRITTFTGEYCYNLLEGNTSAESPNYNKEKEEDYIEKEQELLDLYNSDQLDVVDISPDIHASNWVWDRITQFLNTNELIRLMIISIMSLGIIKLILAR